MCSFCKCLQEGYQQFEEILQIEQCPMQVEISYLELVAPIQPKTMGLHQSKSQKYQR